jgi:hypothetical protein
MHAQEYVHGNKAVKPNVLHDLGWRTDDIKFNCTVAERDEVQKRAVVDAGSNNITMLQEHPRYLTWSVVSTKQTCKTWRGSTKMLQQS